MANVLEALKKLRERQVEPPSETTEIEDQGAVLELPLSELANQSLAILVKSYLLGEEIMLVSNPSCLALVGNQYVTYLPEELEALCKLSPDMIKRVHWLKKKTDGEIVKSVISCQENS